jgi:hypothetical protein
MYSPVKLLLKQPQFICSIGMWFLASLLHTRKHSSTGNLFLAHSKCRIDLVVCWVCIRVWRNLHFRRDACIHQYIKWCIQPKAVDSMKVNSIIKATVGQVDKVSTVLSQKGERKWDDDCEWKDWKSLHFPANQKDSPSDRHLFRVELGLEGTHGAGGKGGRQSWALLS